jgi:predicted ATPase/DNA-binding CsgD family transcriptional regulator
VVVSAQSLTPQESLVTPEGLVARRQALGLTQHALGKLLGVRRNTVARWERGELRVARPEWLDRALAELEGRTGSPRLGSESRLPGELSSFVGREDEIASCCALLSVERLVTLTGTGGIGKSRLALKVARGVEALFPDGIYLVDLAPLDNPSFVQRAVATALGLSERPGLSMTEVVIEALRPKRLLLVLDDCDHLVEACGELAERLLREAPNLSILATCREPLDVRGEIAWRVPPLKTPAPGASFEQIESSESVQLFVERVRPVAPWFELNEADGSAVADVCRQLDGIPLALELAAACMKALSLEQLAVRLEHRFKLLTSGSRTAPSRQQTLKATVDWSYSLLNEPERALFRRLSVFAGGWTLDAAERVTAGEPLTPDDTVPLLVRLIDKSLVVSEERSGVVRQSMLETLREYGHDRLVEAGEEQMVRTRHLEWVLTLAEQIDPAELRPGLVAALAREWDNLRTALAWVIELSDAERGLRLAAAAGPLWNFRGHFAEGICWLNRMLHLPGAADLPRLRARAHKWIGILTYGLGDIGAARASITECYDLIAGQPDEECTAPLCVELMANVARASGDLTGSLQLYRQALQKYRELGFRFWEAVTLFYMASVLFEQQDYAASRAACDECLQLGRGRDFTWATSRAGVILAYLANHDGDHAAAETLAQDALSTQRAMDDPSGMGISLRALSQFALEQGRLGRAWSFLVEALEIAHVEGDRMALARTLETTACVLASQAPTQAAEIAGAASALRTRTGTRPWPIEQARLTHWMDLARRKIGGRAFEAGWALGEELSDVVAISAAQQFVAQALAGTPMTDAGPAPDGPLTARQKEVVALIARGLTNDQIAEKLVISRATARAHLEHVLGRLDLHSRAQVAAWAVRNGLAANGR